MEGRYPHGLLLAITNCTDPSKEEAFNAWYNHMHVPDVTAPGIFRPEEGAMLRLGGVASSTYLVAFPAIKKHFQQQGLEAVAEEEGLL